MTDENDRLKKMMDDQTSLPIMPMIMTKVQTIYTCKTCGARIKYDFDLQCYLEHKH